MEIKQLHMYTLLAARQGTESSILPHSWLLNTNTAQASGCAIILIRKKTERFSFFAADQQDLKNGFG